MGRVIASSIAGIVLAAAAAGPARAASVVVYDGFDVGSYGTFSQPNGDQPIFGDELTLAQPGTLTILGITLYNGGGGSILTGTMLVNFYDNTIPYAGGAFTEPLLGSGTIDYDFTASGGLGAGGYSAQYFDFSGFGIHLPQNILLMQQFTETSGDSTANGVFVMDDPAIGSSPPTVFLWSSAIPMGLYQFNGLPSSQFAYYLAVTPDPSPLPASALGGLALLGGLAAFKLRRRAPG